MQTTQDTPASQETLLNYFDGGGTLQEMLGIDPLHLDQLYGYANQRYEQGDYHVAKRYYGLLCAYCHWQADYWLALGLACQRLGEHVEALAAFGRAGTLQLADPYAPFYAAISHQLRGEAAQADKALAAALLRCGDQSRHAELKQEIVRHTSSSAITKE